MAQPLLRIEATTDFVHAIPIIDEATCLLGLTYLQSQLPDSPYCAIPILRGGSRLGRVMSHAHNAPTTSTVMRMKYTNGYDNPPTCLIEPDVKQILQEDGTTLPVYLIEAVVETQGTVHAVIKTMNALINQYNEDRTTSYPHPEYHVVTLVEKISGGVTIPNLIAAFHVSPAIWVHGWGCDNQGWGRKDNRIMGVLAKDALPPAGPPYYENSPGFVKWLTG